MVGVLQPLDKKFAIVDKFGNPTDYFVRWAQQKQIDITGAIQLSDLVAYLDAHKIIAGTGIQFSPGPNGDINQSPTIHADVQAILDEISATRGIIIYRGNLGWAALLPGTAGYVLQTNGAGADPTWVAPAAGGGRNAVNLAAMRPLTDFTQVNVGGATTRTLVEVAGKAITVNETNPVGGPKIAGIMRAVPAGSNWRVAIFIQCNTNWKTYMGSAWGFSDGTQFDVLSDPADGTIGHQTFPNANSRSSYGSITSVRLNWSVGFWVGLRYDGTNVYFEQSSDGVNFVTSQYYTPAAGFLGAAGYTKIFAGIYSEASAVSGVNYAHSASILTWDENGLARTFG